MSQQRKFVNRMLRVVVFEATTTDQALLDIFERINTSGVKARSSEIRRGTYKGHFMDFVSECAEDGLFVKLCPNERYNVASSRGRRTRCCDFSPTPIVISRFGMMLTSSWINMFRNIRIPLIKSDSKANLTIC